MLTYLAILKIGAVVITLEQLVSAAFATFFLTSELLANNPKVKANSVYQLILGYLKVQRKEDDKLTKILKILKSP